MDSNLQIGRQGEKIANKYLQKNGYTIIAKNWRSKRWGEIDIIAEKGGYLVFIEVKTRTTKEFGDPYSAVTYHKLRALKRAANYYICTHNNIPDAYRIDVIGIYLPGSNKLPVIKLYENVS